MIIIIPCNVYVFFFSSLVFSLINLYLFHVYRYQCKKTNRVFHDVAGYSEVFIPHLVVGINIYYIMKRCFGIECFLVNMLCRKNNIEDVSPSKTVIKKKTNTFKGFFLPRVQPL